MASVRRAILGWLGGGVVAVALWSCTKPPFTRGVRDEFGFSNADVQRIQFFTSHEIVLSREVAAQSKELTGHGLVVRDGVRVEEVVIPAHTPCVAARVEGDYLLMAFARGQLDRSLWFALQRDATDADADAGAPESRRYQLAELDNAPSDPRPFEPRAATGFLVTWGGQKYRVASGRNAYLLYQLDTSFHHESVRQEAPGWRLSEGMPPAAPAAAPASAAPATSAVPATSAQPPR